MTSTVKEKLMKFIKDEKITALYHVLQKELSSKMNELFMKKLNKIISSELSNIFKDKMSSFQGKV